MRFFNWFKKKAGTAMQIQGHPVNVISGSPHPDHYDRERNAARIAQLADAIATFTVTGTHEAHPERYAELKAELARQIKIRELFYAGEEG